MRWFQAGVVAEMARRLVLTKDMIGS
jgi:hypothetical protein